jgi:hypothetical protein
MVAAWLFAVVAVRTQGIVGFCKYELYFSEEEDT